MSTVPTINERAWAVDLISEINRLAGQRCRRIQSAGGEWGVSATGSGNMLFPDVLLFGDPSRSAVLQGWELKMPDTPVTDSDLLDNAGKNAGDWGFPRFSCGMLVTPCFIASRMPGGKWYEPGIVQGCGRGQM